MDRIKAIVTLAQKIEDNVAGFNHRHLQKIALPIYLFFASQGIKYASICKHNPKVTNNVMVCLYRGGSGTVSQRREAVYLVDGKNYRVLGELDKSDPLDIEKLRPISEEPETTPPRPATRLLAAAA